MVGDGPGFLLESVERGERWSRFSFVGRSPAATLVARGRQIEVTRAQFPIRFPVTKVCSPVSESILDKLRSPSFEGLPPLHSGLVGYLGYDVVREVERLAAPPTDDLGHPDAVVSVIGELAAFDHWRQRVDARQQRACRAGQGRKWNAVGLRPAYLDALQRLEVIRNDLERPGHEPLVAPPSPGRPSRTAPFGEAPAPSGTARPSRSPRSTSVQATRSRSCCLSASTSTSAATRSMSTGCSGR